MWTAPDHGVISASVAFFRERDRDLQSTYRLDEVVNSPPPALQNLCALAEVDLQSVQNDLTLGRLPHVGAVFEAANAKLRERFSETWRQSDIYPRLSAPLDGIIRILISIEGGDDYYTQRSGATGFDGSLRYTRSWSLTASKNRYYL